MVVLIESNSLIAEVERYLGVVEYFRAEGCDLQWTAELLPAPASESVAPPTAPRTFAGPG